MHRSSSTLSTGSGVSDNEFRPLKRQSRHGSDMDISTSNLKRSSSVVSPDQSLNQVKKIKPIRLVVDQPTTLNDNSIVTLHPDKMSELQLFRGDIVLLHGKLHHTAAAVGKKFTYTVISSSRSPSNTFTSWYHIIALTDETCEMSKVKINKVLRKNLRVRLGDQVRVQPHGLDIPYGKNVRILPMEDTIQGISGNLFETYLKPYFLEAYRPIKKGGYFTIRKAMTSVEFKVVECDPSPFCIVAQDTVIHSEGTPLGRLG